VEPVQLGNASSCEEPGGGSRLASARASTDARVRAGIFLRTGTGVHPSAGHVRACKNQETGRVRAAAFGGGSVAARMQAAGSRAGEQMARRGGSRASGRRGTSARVRAGGEAQQLQVLMFACRQATTSGDSSLNIQSGEYSRVSTTGRCM
jgi:hypothetical protein